jgi:hypothetical protein
MNLAQLACFFSSHAEGKPFIRELSCFPAFLIRLAFARAEIDEGGCEGQT